MRNVTLKEDSAKKKRKGVHAKSKNSKSKKSRNYVKRSRGQG